MILQYKKNRGFTLIEILVVVTIIVIIASFASNSINTAIRMHRQMQAANIVSNAIRNIRSFALSQNLDETKAIYFDSDFGLSTRNAFSLYFFRGRLDPDDGSVVGQGTGTDGWDLNFSVLPVKDPGYFIADRVMGPDHPDVSGSTVENSITDLSSLNGDLHPHLIALPTNIVLLFGAIDDGIIKGGTPSGDLLGNVEHVSYDVDGSLILKLQNYDFSYYAFTSSGFDLKNPYIAVMMVYAGVSVDESLQPIYVDLRTGDIINDTENMPNINWPIFSD